MYYLIVLIFTLIAAWLIFKMARREWRKTEIAEIKSKVKDTESVYNSAKNIDAKKFQKQHSEVEKIKETTDL
jgi:hypothetical protein